MVNAVFQMQEVGGTQGGPQRPFSVLDRLLLTHPVWLQLSLNRNSALYILLREPVGVRMKSTKTLQHTHGRCSVNPLLVVCQFYSLFWLDLVLRFRQGLGLGGWVRLGLSLGGWVRLGLGLGQGWVSLGRLG